MLAVASRRSGSNYRGARRASLLFAGSIVASRHGERGRSWPPAPLTKRLASRRLHGLTDLILGASPSGSSLRGSLPIDARSEQGDGHKHPGDERD